MTSFPTLDALVLIVFIESNSALAESVHNNSVSNASHTLSRPELGLEEACFAELNRISAASIDTFSEKFKITFNASAGHDSGHISSLEFSKVFL